MSPKLILLVLFAHRYAAALAFLLVLSVGAVVTLTTPKTYQATTDLLVDSRTDPIAGVLTGGQNYIATQIAIIQSERVAIGVVKRLRIDQTPTLVNDWRNATGGKVPLENYYANMLRRGLLAEPKRSSNVITLTYEGADPKFVTAVVNTYAQAYLDLTVDLRVEPVRQYANWFDERLKTLRENVESAQTRLSEFQRNKGIVGNADQEIARMDALMSQLVTVQSENAVINSRQRTSGTDMSQEVLASGLVQSLKGEVNALEVKLTEVRLSLGPNHPQRIQLEGQLAALKTQLQSEMSRVAGGTRVAQTAANMHESELRGLINAQKSRVLELRQQRDEIAVLAQDVEAAKRIYDSVLQRSNQLNLEKQSDQANISVLSPAIEPTAPFKPNIPKFIAASVLGALAAAFVAAMGLEFLNRKVRVVDDMMFEDVPLLGVIDRRPPQYSLGDRLALTGKFFSNRKLRKEIASSTHQTPRLT
ncbi:MAG: chain length determinant protein EpsF [Comamonadaceae bacterium]|nr:chain length determinant protein EpsF [Comamonadaceae bacterium]